MSNTTMERNTAIKNGVVRMMLAVLSIFLEVGFIIWVLYGWQKAVWVNGAFRIFAVILALSIYGRHMTSSIKMPWIMLMLALPVFGIVLYTLTGTNYKSLSMKKRYREVDDKVLPLLPENEEIYRALSKRDPYAAQVCHYIREFAKYPVYQDTAVTYYDDAKSGLEAQLTDLSKAEHFIFMEYHAIENAESFHRIRDVLAERVKAGVEVRLFYDDMGSIGLSNTDFIEEMKSYGIHCRVFNPFAIGLNLFLNNRDHRKITVIDGKVGFTGGYNIANEYFHLTEPYGYWKDTGIRLEGNAVKSLTVAFLEMWNAVRNSDRDDTDFDKYLPAISDGNGKPESGRCSACNENKDADESSRPSTCETEETGFVQPYADSPMDEVQVGEDVYTSVAEQACRYCWFVTPYLILTEETIHILSQAARRGIDVRIITPGIPDKKIVYQVTRSYYNALARNGVRIYEYTPGFCHAKMCVCDDRIATCGTINLDYRSLYHHFENGCIMYHDPSVLSIKADFEKMFSVSREVSEQYKGLRSDFLRLWQLILRLFAPLM